MFLICGLGNPGTKYINTRHNIGFNLADKIIDHYDFSLIKEDKLKQLFSGKIKKNKVLILKPLTFMNLSGKPVLETINFFKININELFVIHDDLDLKLAKIKIKNGGGNGGHNGLLSIDDYLGTKYNRIRIGIDHPGQKDLVSKYVLSKFSKIEKDIINETLNIIINNLHLVFSDIPLFLTKVSKK